MGRVLRIRWGGKMRPSHMDAKSVTWTWWTIPVVSEGWTRTSRLKLQDFRLFKKDLRPTLLLLGVEDTDTGSHLHNTSEKLFHLPSIGLQPQLHSGVICRAFKDCHLRPSHWDSDFIGLRCNLGSLMFKIFQAIRMCRPRGELLSRKEQAAWDLVLMTKGIERGLESP